jgi:hypothetical protein
MKPETRPSPDTQQMSHENARAVSQRGRVIACVAPRHQLGEEHVVGGAAGEPASESRQTFVDKPR